MSADGPFEVLFLGATAQQYSGARDSDGDGVPDVFITHDGVREVHLIEADGDEYLDRQRTYVSGQLQEETLFSGRVLVRVLSAAIAGSEDLDPFGTRPDPYFVLSHNQVVVGRSGFVSNSYFPRDDHEATCDWWSLCGPGGTLVRSSGSRSGARCGCYD
jgi:hypothetical protein